MHFDIQPNLDPRLKPLFKKFENLYGATLSAKYPRLANLDIKVDMEIPTVMSDRLNPLHVPKNGANEIRCGEGCALFTNEEIVALIAHEIGHVLAKPTESDCDDVAVELGIHTDIQSAVTKMRNNNPFAYEKLDSVDRLFIPEDTSLDDRLAHLSSIK